MEGRRANGRLATARFGGEGGGVTPGSSGTGGRRTGRSMGPIKRRGPRLRETPELGRSPLLGTCGGFISSIRPIAPSAGPTAVAFSGAIAGSVSGGPPPFGPLGITTRLRSPEAGRVIRGAGRFGGPVIAPGPIALVGHAAASTGRRVAISLICAAISGRVGRRAGRLAASGLRSTSARAAASSVIISRARASASCTWSGGSAAALTRPRGSSPRPTTWFRCIKPANGISSASSFSGRGPPISSPSGASGPCRATTAIRGVTKRW